MAVTASTIVCGSTSRMSSLTGARDRKSRPRSPCSAPVTKSQTWTCTGSSSFISSRTVRESDSLARGPRMILAGSPGHEVHEHREEDHDHDDDDERHRRAACSEVAVPRCPPPCPPVDQAVVNDQAS